MSAPIPFNRPYLTGRELDYIRDAIETRSLSGEGPFTAKCQSLLEQRFGIGKTMLTPSCTSALEMAAMLCGFGPGDEVILPSFTFTSTANAFIHFGAKPVFVDVRHDTLNIDDNLIERAITPYTRAIFPVHYAGVACEMDPILEVAAKYKLLVVEDAAQGVNAFYKGRALGSIGQFGAYSFHVTKNFIAGEGGALCINAHDQGETIERAEIVREKGTNRNRFIRGEVDKYTWVDIGSSFIPSEIVSAFLLAQLEGIDDITARRSAAYDFYMQSLAPLQDKELIRLPVIPKHCASNFHAFYIILPSNRTRDLLQIHLRTKQIYASFHYIPLHSSPMGSKYGWKEGDLPVTEDLSSRLLRLPFFNEISIGDQSRVVEEISSFLVG